MALFQNSVADKFLNTLNKDLVLEKWTLYKNHFLNSVIQENIRNSKEEQYQEGFLRDLFVNILGYTLNPDANFNLTTELKNIKDSKKADGGILSPALSKGEGVQKVVGIIELKGTNTTDLTKIEIQAFGYKNNQKDCVYVVTSNFEKLRFYIDNAIEYIEFNLFQLTENEFELLYLCLSFETISKNIPKKIKDESISEEDRITKDLYKDYSIFKKELFHDLVEKNPQFEPLELFKKSQKLLDRFLFLFFAEDRQLLPPNSVRLILDDWKDLQERDVQIPLYDRYKKYFEYLNTGYKGKRYDVFAYNGGLFKPDAILDTIKIEDNLIYNHTLKLATYDFVSEVDVNILGHIFENSLNELDEMKVALSSTEHAPLPSQISKRKKDGVFYTPKYITKYIVENTVGKLCTEKKQELQLVEQDYISSHGFKPIGKKEKQLQLEKLKQYKNWLLQITIIDPACGSGAFLNEALNFLIAEHTYIDELQAKLFGDALILSDVEKSILENNLFGVDLNEESVEIAKLSLWLRTAQPNRKLNDLNHNIKCGNSLIDDPAIAGDKAFHWQKEFPQIFKMKQLEAFHLVFTTHNSRTSQRMKDLNIQKGPAINLNLNEEIELTKIFKTIILEEHLKVLAYNICKDHIHLIIVCEFDDVTKIAKTLKGKSSFLFSSNWFKPIGTPLWSQKFFFADLDVLKPSEISHQAGYCFKDAYIDTATRYIKGNREKHGLEFSEELNALISDFTMSQEDAFVTEYSGGFDVVIGNPPYFNIQTLGVGSKDAQYIQNKYSEIWQDKSDILFYFFYKAMEISKSEIGFIVSNAFLFSDKAQKLRNYILKDNRISKIINFDKYMIFSDASITSCVTIFSKNPKNIKAIVLKDKQYTITEISDHINNPALEFEVVLEKNKVFALVNDKIGGLNKKIDSNHNQLQDICHIGKGMETAANSVFSFDEYPSQFDVEFIKKRMVGENIDRYVLNFSNSYILYFEHIENFEELPLSIQNHLIENKKILENRADKKRRSTSKWWNFSFPMHKEYYHLNKIWCSYRGTKNKFMLDLSSDYIGLTNTTVIFDTNKDFNLHYILTLLNSKLLDFRYKSIGKQTGGGVFEYFANGVGKLPIPKIPLSDQEPFIEKADKMLSLNAALQDQSQKFQRTIQRKFFTNPMGLNPLDKSINKSINPLGNQLTKKLQNWYLLSYTDFIKELAKQKIKLTLQQEAEWEEYFVSEATKVLALKNEINDTDKAIDAMVYELYGLTPEEIAIVENSN